MADRFVPPLRLLALLCALLVVMGGADADAAKPAGKPAPTAVSPGSRSIARAGSGRPKRRVTTRTRRKKPPYRMKLYRERIARHGKPMRQKLVPVTKQLLRSLRHRGRGGVASSLEAVAHIESVDAYASGTVIAADDQNHTALVLTSNHATYRVDGSAGEAGHVVERVSIGDRVSSEVALLAVDDELDVAILAVRFGPGQQGAKLRAVRFAKRLPQAGDDVFVTGFPGVEDPLAVMAPRYQRGPGRNRQLFGRGVVTDPELTRSVFDLPDGFDLGDDSDIPDGASVRLAIGVDAPGLPGQSGGPVLDARGHLVGVTSFATVLDEELRQGREWETDIAPAFEIAEFIVHDLTGSRSVRGGARVVHKNGWGRTVRGMVDRLVRDLSR